MRVIDRSIVCDPIVLGIKSGYDSVLNGVIVIPKVADEDPVRIRDGMIDLGNYLIVVGRYRKVVREDVAGAVRQGQERLGEVQGNRIELAGGNRIVRVGNTGRIGGRYCRGRGHAHRPAAGSALRKITLTLQRCGHQRRRISGT